MLTNHLFHYLCGMVRLYIISALLWSTVSVSAQGFKVEFDKDRDFSKYKTFRFGEGEIITPKDQRQANEEHVHKWVTSAISRELQLKGLQPSDSSADLIISYAVGTLAKSDAGDVGPMGLTPGSMDRTYMRDYRQGNLMIDLHDRSNLLVWRVSAISDINGASGERMIDQIVQKGFKKYPQAGKTKKKKK